MRNLVLVTTVVALVAAGVWSVVVATAYADDPKYTIKQVMQQAHKGDLLKKVLNGKASDDEKAKLVELYEALGQNMPKKGSAESWKEKTDTILAAVKSGDTAALKKATNCTGCHDVHRGK